MKKIIEIIVFCSILLFFTGALPDDSMAKSGGREFIDADSHFVKIPWLYFSKSDNERKDSDKNWKEALKQRHWEERDHWKWDSDECDDDCFYDDGDSDSDSDSDGFPPPAVVPEPVSSSLFIIGGITLGLRQLRRRKTRHRL